MNWANFWSYASSIINTLLSKQYYQQLISITIVCMLILFVVNAIRHSNIYERR